MTKEKVEVMNWLMEDNNPSIQYRTLTELCNEGKTERTELLYQKIWEDKAIQKMLDKLVDTRSLDSENKKYGSFMALRYLTAFAEMGLKKDKRLDGFVDSIVKELEEKMEQDPTGCAIPLTLRALVMLDYGSREDVFSLINRFAQTQLYDGGFMCKRLLDKKPNRKSCYKASLDGLLLYAECRRNDISVPNMEQLIKYFTKRDIFYTSDKSKMLGEEGKEGWRFIDNFFPVEPLRIGLPLIVSALSVLGVGNDPSMHKAWELLDIKKDEEGKLFLEGTLTKQPNKFGEVGKPNKWMTFYYLLAQKYRNC